MLAILRHESSVTCSFHLSAGGRVALVCTRRFFYFSVPGKFSTLTIEEPSTSFIHDTEDKHMESKSIPITHGNLKTKFTLTKHQHKAEILWALKTAMSHFSYNSAADIADVLRAMFPDSAIAQK